MPRGVGGLFAGKIRGFLFGTVKKNVLFFLDPFCVMLRTARIDVRIERCRSQFEPPLCLFCFSYLCMSLCIFVESYFLNVG